jgi:hypothetical protein
MAVVAVSFSNKVNTVFGDQRCIIGVLDMKNGAGSFNVANFKTVNFAAISAISVNTTGYKTVKPGSAAADGTVTILSCTSGDTFYLMVLGK